MNADRLRRRVSGKVVGGQDLSRLTTYRLGGPAALYFEPEGIEDLVAFANEARVSGNGEADILVLGRGSNLVVSDDGWPGVVIRLGPKFAYLDETKDGGLRAGGATSLPLLANWTARRGLAGLEFTIAIPGSVGGGVRMNAGAHGREMRDALVRARVLDLARGELSEREAAALDLAYRRSNLGDTEMVVEAELSAITEDPAVVRARIDDFRRHRAATQPGAVQNAGSVFRNPPGDHAGRIVEAAGLKGLRIGGAHVSELHANFFIAEPGARAQDVYDLVHEVRRRVMDAHGIDLQPEIRFAGAFTPHAGAMPHKGTS